MAKNPLNHPPETAGRLMSPNVPIVRLDATVGDAERLLAAKGADFETVNYIYVLDGADRLQGVFSVKEIFRSPKDRPVSEAMVRNPAAVRPGADQEQAALLALKHNIKAVPVTGPAGELLGIVPFDTILHILDREAVEDILRFGGAYHRQAAIDDFASIPLFRSVRHRLPWLLLGLGGGLLAAGIIGRFEETLSENLILAAFIPLVVYMADAVGAQMEAFIIRELAVNRAFSFRRFLLKQLAVIAVMGSAIAVVLFAATIYMHGLPAVSAVLALSVMAAVMTSVFAGLLVPYSFSRLGFDPANASGPIATIIQDIMSVFVYFLIATALL